MDTRKGRRTIGQEDRPYFHRTLSVMSQGPTRETIQEVSDQT